MFEEKVLLLDKTGFPNRWIMPDDAAVIITNGRVAWSFGDTLTTLHGGYNRISYTQSTLDIPSVIALDGVMKMRGKCPPLSNDSLFLRDQHLCLYCGKGFTKSKLTRDHIFPQSRGGKSTWDNLATACFRCNNHKKNNCTPEEAGMELIALPYKPNIAEYLILKAQGRILEDQMNFLKGHVSNLILD
ncbi:hypothetical protein PBI_SCTP2_360 [Salicola phage SCTP-2]|nr:hypothetical protein PBI_SCTP2_360 [Salicola phage SCTP-2]